MPVLTKDQVLEAALELRADERAEVLSQLLCEQSPPPLSPEQEYELDEALREHEENPGAGRPWNEFYAELKAKR